MQTADFKKLVLAGREKLQGSTPYQDSYLLHIIDRLDYYIEIYLAAINFAQENKPSLPGKTIFVDYGCGNGMLGLLAKWIGYQQVICIDHDQSSIESARGLSKATGIAIDHFIHGGINSLVEYCREHQLKPSMIIGTDVIEHIYDLEDFFAKLFILNPEQVNVFTTASNPANPFKVRQLRKLHYRDEYLGGYKRHINSLEDEAEYEKPYLEVRREILRGLDPGLNPDKLETMAHQTRGNNFKDIGIALEAFKRTGQLPVISATGTNTCEPFTGSWSERVLPLSQYQKIYQQAGFKLRLKNGFYNIYEAGFLKKKFGALLNLFQRKWGRSGRFTAPFILLAGVAGAKPQEKSSNKNEA